MGHRPIGHAVYVWAMRGGASSVGGPNNQGTKNQAAAAGTQSWVLIGGSCSLL